jgi:hypothetical protein
VLLVNKQEKGSIFQLKSDFYYCAAGILRVSPGVNGEVWAKGE